MTAFFSLQLLDKRSSAFMLYVVDDYEIRLTLMVGLEDGCCLHTLNAILGEVGCHLVEYKCCNALILIVGAHSDNQQVEISNLL